VGTALYFLETTIFYLMNNVQGVPRTGESAEERGWLMFGIFLFGVTGRIDLATLILPFFAVVAVLFLVVNFCRRRNRDDGGRPVGG
jgi:hypothetical protein